MGTGLFSGPTSLQLLLQQGCHGKTFLHWAQAEGKRKVKSADDQLSGKAAAECSLSGASFEPAPTPRASAGDLASAQNTESELAKDHT